MPDPALLTDLGRELRDDLPGWMREDPDVLAVIHCFAKESERLDETAQEVRDGLIPARATALGLSWWEKVFQLTIAPSGLTEDDRRARVLGFCLMMLNDGAGFQWEQAVTLLVGSGWTYDEEDPYTIRLTVPWPPGTPQFLLLEQQVRRFTPAHLDLIIGSEEGFILDESLLDQEPFHAS